MTALSDCAETGKGNLLELSINAARARCSVGEISYALERVWGRHNPIVRVVSGAYISEYGDDAEITKTLNLVNVSLKSLPRVQPYLTVIGIC